MTSPSPLLSLHPAQSFSLSLSTFYSSTLKIFCLSLSTPLSLSLSFFHFLPFSSSPPFCLPLPQLWAFRVQVSREEGIKAGKKEIPLTSLPSSRSPSILAPHLHFPPPWEGVGGGKNLVLNGDCVEEVVFQPGGVVRACVLCGCVVWRLDGGKQE